MKILYLCNKHIYDTKMSRIRFHSIDAISKITDLTYSGIGWPNYDNSRNVQENIDKIYKHSEPDLVIAYKPLELKAFKDIRPFKCIRYNEMWDKRTTRKEIVKSGSDLIICHHLNDMPHYEGIPNIQFVNISHCAEKTIYKDYGEKKTNDILFTGSLASQYPFRRRLFHLMPRLSQYVKCRVMSHPGDPGKPYRQIKGHTLESYAREINKSKITLTCSSKFKYRLGKYTEIPMCASLLAADLPNEDQDFFKQFMLVLDPSWSDEEIVHQLVKYVKNDKRRNEKIQKGLELNKNYTQEKYAERFVKVTKEFFGR